MFVWWNCVHMWWEIWGGGHAWYHSDDHLCDNLDISQIQYSLLLALIRWKWRTSRSRQHGAWQNSKVCKQHIQLVMTIYLLRSPFSLMHTLLQRLCTVCWFLSICCRLLAWCWGHWPHLLHLHRLHEPRALSGWTTGSSCIYITGGSRGSSLRSVELPRKKRKKKAARPSYSRVRHAGKVGGASQLVPSSAQENVRARAWKSTWLGWGLISGRAGDENSHVQCSSNAARV